MGIWNAIRRVLIHLGILAEKATETPEINMSIIERGIRDAQARSEVAAKAAGDLKGQCNLLEDQTKKWKSKETELVALLNTAVQKNDEKNGAIWAQELAGVQADLKDNEEQLAALKAAYENHLSIIDSSNRQLKQFRDEFERMKVKVKLSAQQSAIADLLRASNAGLQDTIGGEMGNAMSQLKTAAATGAGRVQAVQDLARMSGTGADYEKAKREAVGSSLFAAYKAAAAAKTPEVASVVNTTTSSTTSAQPERQKVPTA